MKKRARHFLRAVPCVQKAWLAESAQKRAPQPTCCRRLVGRTRFFCRQDAGSTLQRMGRNNTVTSKFGNIFGNAGKGRCGHGVTRPTHACRNLLLAALFLALSLLSVPSPAATSPRAVLREGKSTKPVWDIKSLGRPPAFQPAQDISAPGVKAIFYEGLPYQGKPSRVFAYYGIPEAPRKGRLPAMVLIHGGGGTAFDAWVRLWNSRGYAAIAMDLCGSVPVGSYGKWQRHDAGGPPGWGGFDQIDWPREDQWTYQAVADVILAHSLLRSFPEIDPGRIGVTGISWGGYLTCIVAGVDQRFRFAVPVYGCGFLGDNSTWLSTFEKLGPEKARRWLEWWDPSVYLARARMPLLWVTGSNDFAYPLDSLQKSYRLARGQRNLCIRVRMPHGHGGAGENPGEILTFANSCLGRGAPLANVVKQGRSQNQVWAKFKSEFGINRAELNFTRDVGKWQDRKWETVPAEIDQPSRKVTARLPDGVKVYYLNLVDQREMVVSSEHVEIID